MLCSFLKVTSGRTGTRTYFENLPDGKMKICTIVKLQGCLERLLRRLIMKFNVGQLNNKCEKGCTKKSILPTMHKRYTKLIENDR